MKTNKQKLTRRLSHAILATDNIAKILIMSGIRVRATYAPPLPDHPRICAYLVSESGEHGATRCFSSRYLEHVLDVGVNWLLERRAEERTAS